MLQLLAQLVGVFVVCGAVVFAAPIAQRLTTPETMPQCEVGKWPEFNFGFAALRLDLGAAMGDAVECEHATTALGDTDQLTTTGTAHYDRASNTPSFRHGGDNWALTLQGLVFWAGDDAAAPAGSVAVPSPGSARLAAAAAHNSAPVASSFLGGRPTPVPIASVTAPASIGSAFLSTSQIASIAALLGIKNDQVQSMTLEEMSQYTQQSGSSVAEVTRTINSTQSP
jgi:hypothetical protein